MRLRHLRLLRRLGPGVRAMSAEVEALIDRYARASHAALVAELSGFAALAAAMRYEAELLASQARKAAGK